MSVLLLPTDWGWWGLVDGPRGLRRVVLPGRPPERLREELEAGVGEPSPLLQELAERIRRYLRGEPVDFEGLPLELEGCSAFARRVWEATRRIPYGQTRSYAQLAREVGVPGAARAVGRALGANPLPLVIPCHRVVRSDGSPGGFSGGVGLKRRMLELEAQRRLRS